MEMPPNLNVIIPVYNEEKNLPYCLKSLANQTLKPSKVIIVNDGSTDRSVEIVNSFKDETYHILNLQRTDVDASTYGVSLRYAWILSRGSKKLSKDFDYVAILDADTVLEPRYYEKLIQKLEENPKLGIVGGAYLNQPDPGLTLGLLPFVYGCNRVFTRQCWLDINDGFVMKVVGRPDTYQHLRAKMLGYNPQRFDDVKSYCLRPAILEMFGAGYFSWMLGYYPWYLLLRAVRNHSPRMVAGYLKAWTVKQVQYEVKPLVRRTQVERIKRIVQSCLQFL
jgi:glycosyltransferase involved in cell wall biosynthesis